MDLGSQRDFLEVALRMKSVGKEQGRERGMMVGQRGVPLEEAASQRIF